MRGWLLGPTVSLGLFLTLASILHQIAQSAGYTGFGSPISALVLFALWIISNVFVYLTFERFWPDWWRD